MNSFSIRHQSCPNVFCDFHDQVLAGNVIIHSSTAKRMKCTVCKTTWVAHINDISFGLKTDAAKVNRALAMLKASMSIRSVARLIGVSPSTVQRWKKRFNFLTEHDESPH